MSLLAFSEIGRDFYQFFSIIFRRIRDEMSPVMKYSLFSVSEFLSFDLNWVFSIPETAFFLILLLIEIIASSNIL